MPFPTRTLRTGTSAPQETPYQRAAQEWDRRMGDARVQARNWRYFAFGSLAVSAMLAGTLIYEVNHAHVLVDLVPITATNQPGRVILAGNDYRPTEAETASFLAAWVKDFFSESTDPVVFSQRDRRSFAVLAGAAQTYVAQWAQKHPPNKDLGKRAVSIEVTSVLQRSPLTYQVNWIKKVYESGALTKTVSETGLFTVTLHAPTTQAQVLANPLGLYITNASWSHQF